MKKGEGRRRHSGMWRDASLTEQVPSPGLSGSESDSRSEMGRSGVAPRQAMPIRTALSDPGHRRVGTPFRTAAISVTLTSMGRTCCDQATRASAGETRRSVRRIGNGARFIGVE
jgi:hypothetical protein